jgi:DNA-binding transcriptional LysR family regulator
MNDAHSGPDTDAARERLAAVDLNLIVAFDALARELNVTRAAQRMGVTQSAMSHALRRMRELLADPLLVRGRGGMVLTPRAESLVVPLRGALLTLGRALAQPARFDPRSARRAFCLASPDLFDVIAIPALLERIGDCAPGIDIAIVSLDARRLSDQLEAGEVDVGIVPQAEDFRGEQPMPGTSCLLRQTLFRDQLTCLIRADHPALHARRGRRRAPGARAALSLESYAALPHALVSPSGEGPGPVDELLAQHGLKRRIALRIPHFCSALAIVANSDLVLTAPAALAQRAPEEVVAVALPPTLRMPRHGVNLVWHERFSRDPGHVWLRGLVAEVARSREVLRPRAPAPGARQ